MNGGAPWAAAAVGALCLISQAFADGDGLSVEGRTLVDRHGEALVLVGDSAWSLLAQLDLPQAEHYLRRRRAQGFNALLVNLIEHHFGGPADAYGEAPFTATPFASMNRRYFDRARSIVAMARDLGFVVFLAPAYVGYECGEQGWCAEMRAAGVEPLREYGRFVGRHFREFSNVVWVHGGDADAVAHGLDAEVAAVAAGIREFAPAQLHTAMCSRGRSAVDCYRWLQLDIDAVYGACDTVAEGVRRAARASSMPFVLLEGRYEGEGATLSCIRHQAFAALFGGATGYFYGHRYVWPFDERWKSVLEAPGARAVVDARRVLERLRISGTRPDGVRAVLAGVVVDGDWRRRRTLAGMAEDVVAAYVGNPSEVLVRAPGGRCGAAPVLWVDLAKGARRLEVARRCWLGVLKTRPPYEADWLLVLDARRGGRCQS